MKRPVVNFLQVASLVMLLVALALLSAIATMHFAIHGAEVQVPALQGMTVADARSQTAGLGLNLDVDNRYYSSDVAAGHILTQLPPAGTLSTVQLIGWFPVLFITFLASIYVLLKVPSLTNHIFSGTAGGSSAGLLEAPAAVLNRVM